MTPILQKHRYGCAVAVIAMVLGKTYDEVEQTFENNFNEHGMELVKTIEYVGNEGCSAVHTYITNYSDRNFARTHLLKPFAEHHILRVVPRFDSENGHVVYMDKKGKLFDPEGLTEKDMKTFYQITDVVGIWKT